MLISWLIFIQLNFIFLLHLCEKVCHQNFLQWQRNSPDGNAVITKCHKKMQPCHTGRVQKGPQNLFPRNPEAPVTVQLSNKAKYFWQQTKGQSQFECRLSPKYPLYHPPIPQTTWWENHPNLCWSSAPFWGHDPCRAAHKSLTKELLLLVNLTTLKCHCLEVKASVTENIFSIFVEIGSKTFAAWAGHQNL